VLLPTSSLTGHDLPSVHGRRHTAQMWGRGEADDFVEECHRMRPRRESIVGTDN